MTEIIASRQNQKDQFIRRSAEWSRTDEKSEMFLRTGYFNNYMYYVNPAFNENSKHKSTSSISEFENNYKFNSNFKLNTGINYTHEKGESLNLDKTHLRDRSAIFTSLKYNTINNKFITVLSLREEIINNKNTPVTYSFGLDGEIAKGLNIRGNINKSYRIPTMNDLYWSDKAWGMYGNSDLKNEEGLNKEASLNYKYSIKKFSFGIGVT